MRREIKYRIWDKYNQVMYPHRKVKVSLKLLCAILDPSDPHLIPLQYTELKDINDRKIYEGDIVEQTTTLYSHDTGIYYENIGEVKMFDGRWVIDSGWGQAALFSEVEENKIIGNIYETPERRDSKKIPTN